MSNNISKFARPVFLRPVFRPTLFIVSKQCACSRRVHIEGQMNRFEYCHPDNNSDSDSFGFFLSKNRIFCSITRC